MENLCALCIHAVYGKIQLLIHGTFPECILTTANRLTAPTRYPSVTEINVDCRGRVGEVKAPRPQIVILLSMWRERARATLRASSEISYFIFEN